MTPPSGTGFIGSFTALALLEAGYKVVIVDNLYNSSDEVLNRMELICGKKPDFVNLDVTDEAAFDRVFKAHPDIDSVIHFAALKVLLSNSSSLSRKAFPDSNISRQSENPANGLWITTTSMSMARSACFAP